MELNMHQTLYNPRTWISSDSYSRDHAFYFPLSFWKKAETMDDVICNTRFSSVFQLHPMEWSKEDVAVWLNYCASEYSLNVDIKSNSQLNGKAFCLLDKVDFRNRFPVNGDILYNALQCLLRSYDITYARYAFAGYNTHLTSSALSSSYSMLPMTSSQPLMEKDVLPISPPVSPVSGPSGEKLKQSLPNPEAYVSNDGCSRSYSSEEDNEPPLSINNSSVRLLWDFLYQLLENPQAYKHIIRWKDRSNAVFHIAEPEELARMWGVQKNHSQMTFDKLSRALRYYYRVNILKKINGERQCYRFLHSPVKLRNRKQRELLEVSTQE